MTNGSVTLNGVTDKQLVAVLEAKIKHEGQLFFNPQHVQLAQTNPPRPNLTVNNNVLLTWNNEVGYKAAIELMAELMAHRLIAKEAA